MPLSLDEILTAYQPDALAHADWMPLALRDSARRQWEVDVRHDARGRYLQFRPIGIDIERFRASADGHRPGEWLPIAGREWAAFAILAAGGPGGAAPGVDQELALLVRRLLDRMVRDAQHQGLAFDDDED